MSLPDGYIKWVTRVSDLVSFKYPFAGTNAEMRYLQWLEQKNISESDYHTEACDVWTFVHLQMEKYIEWQELDISDEMFDKHKTEVNWWLRFIWDYGLTNMQTEIYCRDPQNRYQWSIDLLAECEWKNILLDWKTWWIAKKKFWLPNKTTKPYWKLKKVALQMSLYAKALWNIDEIWVVWLHDEDYFVYKLEMVDDETLEELLEEFAEEKKPLTITENNMEIEILKPTEQFGNVKVRLDLSKADEGKTDREMIDYAIEQAKYMAKQMK